MSSPVITESDQGPKLTKSSPISLREAGITESWLERHIETDPTILRLGDVTMIQRQRRQEKAGRLDLLLEDDSGDKRYEVELMLGSTDESHLVRTIEYWDIERRKWPGYEHCAVLIAEDVITRFLNVISLFSGSVPFVVIQVNALQVDGKLVLNFVKVLDSRSLRTDEATELKEKATDRAYWVSLASPATVELAEKCIAIINEVATVPRKPSYNKYYIGLNDGVRPGNFVTFKPRKSFLRLKFEALTTTEIWIKRLQDIGLESDVKNDDLRVFVTPKDFDDHKALLTELLQEAVRQYEKD
ncbi:MAG TPA: hypothetical protein VN881_10060 [Candidatus Acidoferrales bacterium]|nr:hypothetical protein [Candidatus Acidoferrales bacterium]